MSGTLTSLREPWFPENLENYAPWVTRHGLTAPYGMCQCGCDEKTSLAPQSHTRTGMRKDHPLRYVAGHHNQGRRKSLAARFWAKVRKSDGCWEWIGCKQSQGYGQIRIEGRALLAHRVSWEMEFGPIEDGLWILHKCDNPACVRPDHLFLGDVVDNNADMTEKGRRRSPSGEESASAKLTNNQVARMRKLYFAGKYSTYALAEMYGVSHFTIWEIVRNRRYRIQGGEYV